MNKHFTQRIFTIALLLITHFSFAQPDVWKAKQSLYNLVAGRSEAVAFSMNGKGYLATGFSFGFGTLAGWNNDLWQYDSLTNSWTQMASMPVKGRQSATAFVINGKAYVGCGICGFRNPFNDFWEYDPSTNGWTQKANIPNHGLQGPLSFSIGGKGYVGFGTDQQGYYQRGIWEYNPAADSWKKKNDFPSANVWESFAMSDGTFGYAGLGYDVSKYSFVPDIWQYNPSNDLWTQKNDFAGGPRFGETGLVVNNKLYIACGENGDTYEFINDVWEYNAEQDSWTSKGNFLGHPRGDAVGFSIGDNGYLATGYDASSSGRQLEDLWELNTISNTWRQRADLGGGPRDMAVGFSYGNNGIVSTGEDGTRFKKDVWQYSPSADAWTRTTDLTYGKRNATGFSVGSKMYIGLGLVDTIGGIFDPKSTAEDFWAYDSISKTWTQVANFGGGVRGAAASFVINDKAYVGTGFAVNNVKNDFWEYDPVANSWKQKSNFPGKRRSYAVSFSINGKGYIGMGIGTHGDMKDFYEYDPGSDRWIQKANFAGTQRSYNVGVAIGNKGYVGLGVNYNNHFIHDWWEFDPVANSWIEKTNFPAKGRWGANAFNIGSKAYVGMGVIDTLYATNDLWEYSPVADVRISKNDFISSSCFSWTGNDFNWFQDDHEDLVMAINSSDNNLGSTCWGVQADAAKNYQDRTWWFGGNEKQAGAYLKRTFFITPTVQPESSVIVRIYCTARELADFINYFNSKYGTSFTENDLRIIAYNGTDADLEVNNDEDNSKDYTSIKPVIGNYGVLNEYRYLEFTTSSLDQFSIGLTRESVIASVEGINSIMPAILISPNPFKDQLELKVVTDKVQSFDLRITDVNGKLIEQRLVSTSDDLYFGSSYAKGVYFLYLNNDRWQLPVQRIVKE